MNNKSVCLVCYKNMIRVPHCWAYLFNFSLFFTNPIRVHCISSTFLLSMPRPQAYTNIYCIFIILSVKVLGWSEECRRLPWLPQPQLPLPEGRLLPGKKTAGIVWLTPKTALLPCLHSLRNSLQSDMEGKIRSFAT